MESQEQPEVKLHRRTVMLDGREFTILTPRPQTPVRFATNRFHETWHILSDRHGGQLLARFCWAMAYQRKARALLLIDQPLLVPNPFDADQSSSILVVNSDLGTPSRDAMGMLKALLPWKTRPQGTVRLHARGLDHALANKADFWATHLRSDDWWNEHRQRRWIDRVNGIVVLSAPPPVLKAWAVELADIGSRWYRGADSTYLDHAGSEGEVQVFDQFAAMVDRAIETRRRLYPGSERRALSDDERKHVWATASEQDENGFA